MIVFSLLENSVVTSIVENESHLLVATSVEESSEHYFQQGVCSLEQEIECSYKKENNFNQFE